MRQRLSVVSTDNFWYSFPQKTFLNILCAKQCQYNDNNSSNQSNQNTWIRIYVTVDLFFSTYFHTDYFSLLCSVQRFFWETTLEIFHYTLYQHTVAYFLCFSDKIFPFILIFSLSTQMVCVVLSLCMSNDTWNYCGFSNIGVNDSRDKCTSHYIW